MLSIRVHGTPAPQGSKKGFYNKHSGKVQMVESSAGVKPWREGVKHAALDQREKVSHQTFVGPVAVMVRFMLARPKGHFGTGRNAGKVKPSAPPHPSTRPDLDKLARSTFDALREAGVYRDDSQVVVQVVAKVYAVGEEIPGAMIHLTELES